MKSIIRFLSLILAIALFAMPLSSCDGEGNGNDNSDSAGDGANKELPAYGNVLGKRCIATDLELISGDGTVNIKDYLDKVVVINFWGTWCGPCKSELPHFSEVAEEYKDEVVILTVHSNYGIENAEAYILENFSDSKMIFAMDKASDGYYRALNPGQTSYPITIVLDKDGVISYKMGGAISKNALVSEIEKVK